MFWSIVANWVATSAAFNPGEPQRAAIVAAIAAAAEGNPLFLEQLAAMMVLRLAEPRARWTLGELAAKWLSRVRRVRLADDHQQQ